ncbi:hypothetical protein IJI29_01370 [Candidatus Saccharibacteria bacterium]|nr:hypothetical protein [Candidatus Saccharibacteria bacterium]MDO5475374.1 hypothetical protein [Candidatus Saccharibacteria bacterium]
MVFDLSKINGIENYEVKSDTDKNDKPRKLYYRDEKVFLVENPHTIELRCDEKLSRHLMNEYESVMESRYFGRGGIEIVPAGQLTADEINDLIRLSYDLTI